MITLCKKYATVIRKIERGVDRDLAQELDHEREDLHNEIQDIMYRLDITHDRDEVNSIALRIARDE